MRRKDKSCKLIQSYVKEKYFVSTAYRSSSAMVLPEMWYFETMVWDWNSETKQRGDWIIQEDSGTFESEAMDNHAKICRDLIIK